MISMVNYLVLWACYTGFIIYHLWYSLKTEKKILYLSRELEKKNKEVKK